MLEVEKCEPNFVVQKLGMDVFQFVLPSIYCLSPQSVKWTLPVAKLFIPPVVLLLFTSRFVLVRYKIDSNMTGSQKKIWTRTASHGAVIILDPPNAKE